MWKVIPFLLLSVVANTQGFNGKPLRWGIVSHGKISNDFVNALSTLPKSDHVVVAIAARNLSDAQSFATKHKIPKAYGGYKQLAQDPEVDVAFIGTINLVHFDNAKLMLENKKHVLCEKPMTLNAKQTKALIQIAKANDVFLMEAMWSRFTPAYQKIRSILKEGRLGEVTHVAANIGLDMSDVPRVMRADLGGGSTMDIGIYPLQFQQFVFGSKAVDRIQAIGTLNNHGADVDMMSRLTYPSGQFASMIVSLVKSIPNQGFIVGTNGTLSVPNHNCPQKLILHTNDGEMKEYNFPLPESDLHYNYPNTIAFIYQAEAVRQHLIAGLKESPLMPWSDSLQLAEWMDNIRNQIGVHFAADD